jgi:hypothetical protein
MAEIRMALQEISLAKALNIKNRLTGRLAKVQADIQSFNSVPVGQADQVNVLAHMKARDELVGALVSLKTPINDANRESSGTSTTRPRRRPWRSSCAASTPGTARSRPCTLPPSMSTTSLP